MTDTTPSWAVPGAKVVCVDAGDTGGVLTRRGEYTIIRAYADFLVLLELPEGSQDGWFVTRFRPAAAQKTEQEDTAMFERIARGTTVLERLDLLREKLDA